MIPGNPKTFALEYRLLEFLPKSGKLVFRTNPTRKGEKHEKAHF